MCLHTATRHPRLLAARCPPQVSEPPKKLRKWRKKLAKRKNQVIVPVGRDGRTLTVPNWAYKGPGDLYRGVSGAILGTLPTALVYVVVYDRASAALERALAAHAGASAAAAAAAAAARPQAALGGAGNGGEGQSGGVVAARPRQVNGTHERAAGVHLLSAAAGAICSSVVRVPGDTIRHQTQAYMHRNVFAAFGNIVTARGVAGLYLGYLPTLLRDVPELAIQFTVYEALRKGVTTYRAAQLARQQQALPPQLRRRAARGGKGRDDPSNYKLATWEHLILGGRAGAAAATVTMPLDFVKTRQQCGAAGGVLGLVRSVVAAEGVQGLFAGLAPRVCHVACTSSVFFGLFEGAKLLLKPERTEKDRLLLPKVSPGSACAMWQCRCRWGVTARLTAPAPPLSADHGQAQRPRVEAPAGLGMMAYIHRICASVRLCVWLLQEDLATSAGPLSDSPQEQFTVSWGGLARRACDPAHLTKMVAAAKARAQPGPARVGGSSTPPASTPPDTRPSRPLRRRRPRLERASTPGSSWS